MTTVVWFRRDLRVHDNRTLAAAIEDSDAVAPLYVRDDEGRTMFELPRPSVHRARFLRESLADLRQQLRERGSDLLVRDGSPADAVAEVAHEYDADSIYFQTLPADEERRQARAVRERADDLGLDTRQFWTHTLYHRDDLPVGIPDIDDTFTPWRKRVEAETTVRDPLEPPQSVPSPTLETDPLPAVSGFDATAWLAERGEPADARRSDPPSDERAVLDFAGGERAGRQRLADYVWERDRLRSYKETRNGLLGADYSSKLSPWLALGCLSPRLVSAEIDRYERRRVENDSTYWLRFELAWRDFFQFQFAKHGAAFFRPGGIRGLGTSWSTDRERFRRWARGETGFPFVDANMRELNRTGYMSNRGRQNVASFLTDWLGVDWRLGAAYFEATLVDYDPCSNWGNWAYQAGVGNDSRDGRYFHVVGQGKRYDGDGEYVRTWLPELDGLDGATVHEPWTLDARESAAHGVELGVDYPEPMVDPDGPA